MTFPYDIWLNIARFIPPLVLGELYSVNSTLFELAMEQRYRQISFAYLSKKMIRMLVRLKDPSVAKRVRVLYMHPHFVKEVLDKGTIAASTSSSSIYSRKMSEIAHHIREQKLFGKSFGSAKSRALPTLKTPEDVIQVMVDVLSGLSNVTDYHIAWCGLPTIHELPVPFLAAVFRPTLKKLWLDISLENLKNLLYHSGFARLQSLEELDLFIRIENESPATNDTILDPHDHIMINYLAPALNQLHLTLRKLSIRLWQPLDLSPLFISLRPMPQLEHLSIEIPMSTPHLGNPVGLSDFLNLHSPHLRALSLRASEFSGMGLTPVDTSIRSWIGMAFPPVCLAKLQQLEISLALIPFESALVCLERFARTLTSLVLTGTYLSYSQISMMLDVLARKQPGGLQCLKMGSVTLSPQLVDSLAEKVQGLRQLKLLVREVVPCEGDLPIFYEKDQDDSQLGKFFEEMAKRHYPYWELRHLALVRSSFPFRLQYESQYKEVFTHGVPSLQTFA